MRTHQEIFEALAAPFPDNEIRYRPRGGRQLAYITARMARRRLNEVLGPFRWDCELEPSDRWVLCTITATLDDGHVVRRTAMGGYPPMEEEEDRVKGGDSDAFKRCCVLFGIGESLYDDPDHGQASSAQRPPSRLGESPSRQWEPSPQRGDPRDDRSPPRTGGALYAWVCRLEEQTGAPAKSIVRKIDNAFGPTSPHNYPRQWKDWSPNQVAAAVTFMNAEYGVKGEAADAPPY
jgi:hypothetical protein